MQKLIAEWNTDLKLWGNSRTDLLSEHWEPFSETWPTSGTMRNGQAFELQMPTLRIKDLESLSLPTPTTQDGKNNGGPSQFERNTKPLNAQVLVKTDWNKFQPAVRSWEQEIGRKAPTPTKPDGKKGAHRLSSKFTEWMMGLPEGWITDVGLTRNEELKLAGNGVVPQQAELALRLLLNSDEE